MSFGFWFFTAVVMFVLSIFIVKFGLSWAIIQMSKMDVWWSPYRTLPPPGEMFIIVRGDSNGPFDSVIESVLTHRYDEPTQEFKEELATPRVREDYLSELGVANVGFFKYLLHREVRHDKWEKMPNSTEFGIVSKVRPGPSIFFRYNMATEIKAAETKGNFPVDAVMVFTVEITKPVKAFFLAGGWEIQTTAAVSGKFREYVSNKDIDELRKEHEAKDESLVKEIKSLSDELYEQFGVVITDAKFVLFDLVSGDRDEAMIKAVRATEIARLEAEADIQRGKGEGQRRIERAAGIQAEVAAWGSHPVGGQIAIAEAIKEAKPRVLGGNFVVSVDEKE